MAKKKDDKEDIIMERVRQDKEDIIMERVRQLASAVLRDTYDDDDIDDEGRVELLDEFMEDHAAVVEAVVLGQLSILAPDYLLDEDEDEDDDDDDDADDDDDDDDEPKEKKNKIIDAEYTEVTSSQATKRSRS